jgi:hypothetical protein
MTMDIRRTAALTIGALAIGVALTGGIAVAAGSKTVHTCASKKTGALRVAKHCSHNEKAYSLGARGPRGASGPSDPGYLGVMVGALALSPTPQKLVGFTLPPGSYVLSASVNFTNSSTAGPAYPGCYFKYGDGIGDETYQFVDAAKDLGGTSVGLVNGSLAITAAVTTHRLTPLPMEFDCQGPATVTGLASMTAVKVSKLNITNSTLDQ